MWGISCVFFNREHVLFFIFLGKASRSNSTNVVVIERCYSLYVYALFYKQPIKNAYSGRNCFCCLVKKSHVAAEEGVRHSCKARVWRQRESYRRQRAAQISKQEIVETRQCVTVKRTHNKINSLVPRCSVYFLYLLLSSSLLLLLRASEVKAVLL